MLSAFNCQALKCLTALRRMSDHLNGSALIKKYMEEKEFFLEKNLPVKEPFCIFCEWLNVAMQSTEVLEAKGACLATVNKEGRPSNRYMMLTDITDYDFRFFTYYGSQKACDIAENPNVALTFYWGPLRRQVRIEGVAEKLTWAESLDQFRKLSRLSQIGVLASEQSSNIPTREFLDDFEECIKAKVGPEGEVPFPNWGGYSLRPRLIEFWQGQTNRLHDRIRFRKGPEIQAEIDDNLVHAGENGWIYERLAP